MDKTATNKRKKVILDGSKGMPSSFAVRVSPEDLTDLENIQRTVDAIWSETFDTLDKASKSLFADKDLFHVAKELLKFEWMIIRNSYTQFYAFKDLDTRLSNVEKIIQGITEKVNFDLSSIKSEVESLHKTINEPAFADVQKFVQFVNQKIEESKKEGKFVV